MLGITVGLEIPCIIKMRHREGEKAGAERGLDVLRRHVRMSSLGLLRPSCHTYSGRRCQMLSYRLALFSQKRAVSTLAAPQMAAHSVSRGVLVSDRNRLDDIRMFGVD